MLVLTRRINESIVINGDIVVTVLEVGRNGQVRLGIEAPRHYQVYRRELWQEIERENREALASAANKPPDDLSLPSRGGQENNPGAANKPQPPTHSPG